MKFVDEFRDAARLQARLAEIRRACSQRWTIMDVCGGQTHNLLRYGIEAELADCVELIHGPGCPVCVTPADVIDTAIALAGNSRVILASFGDMLRVPGRTGSLLQARAYGADVRMVYNPSSAVKLAAAHPDREVVFLAVGFETTIPTTALALLQAEQQELTNFSVLSHHVRVEPAMRALLSDPARTMDGFLAAGHVCTVTGTRALEQLSRDFQIPIVVTGFEPLDLADGLRLCVRQLAENRAELENGYPRFVRADGNPAALKLIDRVFSVTDQNWRGFGWIASGGYDLRPDYQKFNARAKFGIAEAAPRNATEDRYCAAVLSGRWKPPQCPLFGSACLPETPHGAPMVSSEGACAAYYRYSRAGDPVHD